MNWREIVLLMALILMFGPACYADSVIFDDKSFPDEQNLLQSEQQALPMNKAWVWVGTTIDADGTMRHFFYDQASVVHLPDGKISVAVGTVPDGIARMVIDREAGVFLVAESASAGQDWLPIGNYPETMMALLANQLCEGCQSRSGQAKHAS